MTPGEALSFVILTRNEEDHLPGCLESVSGVDATIIVLDSGSTDQTVEIAQAAGATVYCRHFSGYADQRNAALDLCATEWVFFLDADERLPHPLMNEILEVIDGTHSNVTGYAVPRKNIAFGRLLRGGGWWPDYQMRLLRRVNARYRAERQVHETVDLDGDMMFLSKHLIHFNYETRVEFMMKQRHYTTIVRNDEGEARSRPRRRRYLGAPARGLWRRFIELKGYRDGLDGLFMATVLAFEEFRSIWLQRRSAR